jgi:hypothetical protein
MPFLIPLWKMPLVYDELYRGPTIATSPFLDCLLLPLPLLPFSFSFPPTPLLPRIASECLADGQIEQTLRAMRRSE